MNINRNNYEEFLLLYADNELSFNERQAVESFLESNPDLKTELQSILDSKLHTEHISFFNKAMLYKNDSFITAENYESFFLLYADNELTAEEKNETEKYAASTPALQKEFDLIQQTRIEADKKIVFEDKSVLYKQEEPARVIPIAWMKMAVAAAVIGIILLAGVWWLNKKTGNTEPELVKKEMPAENKTGDKNTPQQNTPAVLLPGTEQNVVTAGDDNKPTITDTDKQKQQPVNNQKALQQNIAVVATNVKESKKENSVVTKQDDVPYEIARNDANSVLPKTDGTGESPETITKPDGVAKAAKPKDIVDKAVGPEEINQNAKAAVNYEEEENKTSFAVFPVTDDKVQKSGLRGLFRKVKRVISRRNSNDNDEQDSKKIYIGSFAIARAK